MPANQDRPLVLVADDDTISQRFFAAALSELGCEVVVVPDGNAVLDETRRRPFALLLLDCRMPDLGGSALLAELRKRDVDTTAIATTADTDTASIARLRAAGFSACLTKPITVQRLHQELCAHLPDTPLSRAGAGPATRDTIVLDDSSALKTSGNPRVVKSLRALFVTELEDFLSGPIRFAPRCDIATMSDRLHRLRASCGFCGASMLANATVEFEKALRESGSVAPSAHARFVAACEKTLEALRCQL